MDKPICCGGKASSAGYIGFHHVRDFAYMIGCFFHRRTNEMGRLALLSVAWIIAGCATPERITYSPTPMDTQSASKVIVQALMEQPAQFRPSDVTIDSEYIDIDYGEVSRTRHTASLVSVHSSSYSKKKVTRLYFNSIGTMDIVHRKSFYVARVDNEGATVSLRMYMASKPRAIAVLDAINSLKNHSK